MFEKIISVSLLLAIFCTSYIQSVPFITKCKSDDSKCMKESAQVAIPIVALGLPEYGIKSLEPLTIGKVDASSPNLKFILTDINIKGLKNCIAKKIKREKSKSKVLIILSCTVDLDSNYEMKGKLLFLPIEGNGPLHVKLRKFEITVDLNLDQGDKWNIKSYDYSYELKDNSDVVFENLFNGNEELAKAARDVFSKSGNEIIMEVGPPVIKAIVTDLMKVINKIFHAVPASELSID